MKKTYLQKGFTLIELLVVIAIIGILSSVVLASLSTARNRSKDTAIKAGLVSLRTQMEIDSNGTNYGSAAYNTTVGDNTTCGLGNFNANTIIPIKNNITSNTSVTTNIFCSADSVTNASKWAVMAVLPAAGGMQCVDSSGNTQFYASLTAPAAGTSGTGGVCK